ncbi:MAG: transposase [Candidatus Microthrix sp.]|nr:transposase [Candidatus Microthrix sp.]
MSDPYTQKVREGGRVVNVSAVVATAVNGEGRQEIIRVSTSSRPSRQRRGPRSCGAWSPVGSPVLSS